MTIFDGMFTGLVIGLIFSIPSFVSETLRHRRNLPLLMDVRTFWGKTISEENVFLISVAVHLLLAVIFGGVYPLLAEIGLVSSFTLPALLIYGLVFYLLFGLLVAPALRIGFFGSKEGHFVWLELLVSFILYALGFWYVSTYILVV